MCGTRQEEGAMNSKDYILYAMEKGNSNMNKLSLGLGRTRTFMFNSLKNNKSITMSNLVEIGRVLGFEVVCRRGDEETVIDG